MSIQQSLDGHSFSRPELDRVTEGDRVRVVELLSPRTMLVPDGLFCEESARELLAANGMPPAAGECIVVCRKVEKLLGHDPAEEEAGGSRGDESARMSDRNNTVNAGEVVALVAVEERILHEIQRKCPAARFTTPLLDEPTNRRKCVWICRREQLLYIKVYDRERLRMAEVIPAAVEPETGYFIHKLRQIFPLKEFELHVSGDNPKELRRWIGKEFEKVICE